MVTSSISTKYHNLSHEHDPDTDIHEPVMIDLKVEEIVGVVTGKAHSYSQKQLTYR